MSTTKVSIMAIFWTLGTEKQGENTEKRKPGSKEIKSGREIAKECF